MNGGTGSVTAMAWRGPATVVLALLVAVPVPAAIAREAVGVWAGWGAFRDADATGRRCFALAVPVRTGSRSGRWRPYVSVSAWPALGRRDVVFVRLSRVLAPGEAATLAVGERRFRLAGRGSAAWSGDEAAGHAIAAALRGQRSMSVEGVDGAGQPFADTYRLAGAATAIDAAILGCR